MPSARQSAVKAVRLLQEAGFESYFAGGCVRDVLLGRTPKDYDIATAATPNEVQTVFPRSKAIGKAFGVIQTCIAGTHLEIATFRSDHNYTDGRHPSKVTFTTARKDAQRRDFTINAIFFDPVADQYVDYCDGTSDIKSRILRCVGSPTARFKEDHLRMLRAIRFASVLDFRIDGATAASIKTSARLIADISSERVRDELLRILGEAQQPGSAVLLMNKLGLLPHVLPKTNASISSLQLATLASILNHLAAHKTPFTAFTALLLRTGAERSRPVRQSTLEIIRGATIKELELLRMPNLWKRHIIKAQRLYWRLTLARKTLDRALLPELAEDYAETAISIIAAQASRNDEAVTLKQLAAKIRARLSTTLVSGTDLKNAGVPPGPAMKHMLREARILQAEGIRSRERILKAVKRS